MGFRAFLNSMPLWLAFLGTAALIVVCWGIGFRLGNRNIASGTPKESLEGEVVAAALGMLAFVLAITFGMAESRYDARRQVLFDEVVAIRTAYLRAGLVAEPDRSAVRRLLREYTDARIGVATTLDIAAASARAEALHDSLWVHAVTIAGANPTDIGGMVVEGVNDVVTIHVQRAALARAVRIPEAIWLALYVLTALGMVMLGHHFGVKGDRPSFGVAGLAISFALVILLIDALDRPQQGFFTLSQQPMAELRAWMDATRAP
jgi:hypothetical protein